MHFDLNCLYATTIFEAFLICDFQSINSFNYSDDGIIFKVNIVNFPKQGKNKFCK